MLQILISFLLITNYLYTTMLPDYPHKVFNDKRINYSLLMEALAMSAYHIMHVHVIF